MNSLIGSTFFFVGDSDIRLRVPQIKRIYITLYLLTS